MKKTFLFTAFSALLLTGCNNDDSIRICADFIGTVVSDAEAAYLIELDGGVKYYSSQNLNQSEKKFELGDRLYFRYFEINYDKQPKGADGSKANPYELTNLMYEKMDVYEPVSASEETDKLPNKELTCFYVPYLEQTTIERNYLNLDFVIPTKKDPEFNLVYKGTGQDTLYYEFKAGYADTSDAEREYRFIETFELENLPSKGYIHLTFHSRNIDNRFNGFVSDSTFVLPFELEASR